MGKDKRISRKQAQMRLTQAWNNMIEDCFGLPEKEAKRVMQMMILKPGRRKKIDPKAGQKILSSGLALTLTEQANRHFAKTKIRTEKKLARTLAGIENIREKFPAEVRKALKAVSTMLPRRGGPGRAPKLNSKEASKACDHIAMFIRQKHTLKEALQLMAKSSPALLGKKVGARTLQKAWDRRDQHGGN